MIDFVFFLKLYQELKSVDSTKKLETYSDEKIDTLIKGSEINRQKINTIIDQFLLQYRYSNKKIYLKVYKMLEEIFINRNTLNTYTNDKEKIKKAFELFLTKPNNIELKNTYIKKNKHNEIIDSVKFFRGKNFNITIKNGLVDFKDIKKVENRINSFFDELGYFTLTFLLQLLDKTKKFDLYEFSDSSSKKLIPVGFIFKKSLQNLHPNKKSTTIIKTIFENLINYSSSYFCLYEIQKFNDYESLKFIYSSEKTLIDLIYKQVMCDQIYKIEQYHSSSLLSFIEFLKKKYFHNKTIESIYNIAKELNKNTESYVIVNQLISYHTKDLSNEEISLLKDMLIQKNPNKNYNNFFNFETIDYFEKPFIQKDKNIIFLNKNLFFIGFYHASLKILNIESKTQGKLIEEFAQTYIIKKNIKCIKGDKTYKISKSNRESMNIVSDKLEIDMIVENENKILLFEIKRKYLQKNSKGGNIYNIMYDLSESLIHSQTQLSRHKRYLEKFKSITFNSGEKINLDNRKILKISVSSLDYQGLHDPSISQVLMSQVPFYNLAETKNEDDNAKIEFINKKMKCFGIEIANIGEKEAQDPRSYMDILFINIYQLLFLIEQTRLQDLDFIDEINKITHIRSNQFDFYINYYNFIHKSKALN